MKMNAGVWIGIIGGILGLVIAIVAVLTTTGSAGIYITAGMIAIFGGMFYLFYKLLFQQMFLAARLKKTGIPGKARILEVRDTGVTINNNPQVKLVLEVKNSFGQTYQTTCRVLVSRLNPTAYSPGMEVPVKIDPKNGSRVIIDFDDQRSFRSVNPSFQATNTTALKTELEELQRNHELIQLSGQSAKAIIKEYKWLGAYVNGQNPYVELRLQVLPADKPSFEGITRGVIHESSVEKYQPGKEIFVKYDLYDSTKIAISHS